MKTTKTSLASRHICLRTRIFFVVFLALQFVHINSVQSQSSDFSVNSDFSVSLYKNGGLIGNYTPSEVSSPVIVKMGDEIRFEVNRPDDSSMPQITGVPQTWIARFAGDLMYYCTPSVTPGEYNPFIGMDSRVHNLQLRKYPEGFQVKVPDWEVNGDNAVTWSWTAQRRMSSSLNKYTQEHTWQKYKVTRGVHQRNNQKEGLNMQFLDYWQDNLSNGRFDEYNGQGKYMMGFDPDELLYLNTYHHDTKVAGNEPGQGGGIIKLDTILSRGFFDGEADEVEFDAATGYPKSGVPLNILISAYQKNRTHYKDGRSLPLDYMYNGYEIQDNGTDENHPDGTSTGNNKQPGTIKITLGNKHVTIKMNVIAPLNDDYGFYGSIEGNTWPAVAQKEAIYKLKGLKGLSTEELNKFSLVYSNFDALGNETKTTNELIKLNFADKATISETGIWTSTFEIKNPGYNYITAYYQRDASSEKVIIAGKELKPEFLLFFGEKSLEKKGLGMNVWLNDYRYTRDETYSAKRKFGDGNYKYAKQNVREYVFPKNTETTFNTWDGDPFVFYDSEEWFLSSKAQAKRIPDDYLDGTSSDFSDPSEAFLKYYIDDQEILEGKSGKDFTYTWAKEGTYTLSTEYLNTPDVLTRYNHEIKIVDYGTIEEYGEKKGNIKASNLNDQEIGWLGVDAKFKKKYKLVEVADVLSQYKYKDGPRGNNPENRWGPFNDYDDLYHWKAGEQDIQVPKEIAQLILDYDISSWAWRDWALHYSSNWESGPNKINYGLPNYVLNNQVTRVTHANQYALDRFSSYIKEKLFNPTPPANWQKVVSLVSYTDPLGYRMRTNPSCVYDLKAVWDNDTGAFSGSPLLPRSAVEIQAPEISDEAKDKQEFLFKVKRGTYAIVPNDVLKSADIAVYNIGGGRNDFIAVNFGTEDPIPGPDRHEDLTSSLSPVEIAIAVVGPGIGVIGFSSLFIYKRRGSIRRFFKSGRGRDSEQGEQGEESNPLINNESSKAGVCK